MKKLILAIFSALAGWSFADAPAPFPIEINSQSRVAPEVWTFRNNVRTFRATFKDGTNTVDLTGSTPFMSWSTNELSSGVVTSSWSLVNSGTGGVVDFTFVAAALNYATQTNVYEIGVAGTVAVYNRGRFLIKPSPYSTGTNVQPFVTNQNLSGMSFVNQPWIEQLTLTTSGAAYAWSGTGTTRNLNVPTITGVAGSGGGTTTNVASSNDIIVVSGGGSANVILNVSTSAMRTALAGSFATGTPLYVEAFTGSVGSLSGVATGSPVYVEADTAAIAQLNTASNALRISIGLGVTNLAGAGLAITNLQGLVSTNFVAQGLIQTNLILNGLGDTNNLIADGVLSTNHIRTGLIHTNLAGLVTTNFNVIGLQVTNNLIAQGLINTQLIANGLADTNDVIALGLVTTQLVANGLADTNLSGLVTTNFNVIGLQVTNNLIAQGLINTQLVANGLADTNDVIALGLVTTQLVANGLADTNLSGRVTTNFTAQGLIQTNLVQVGLVVTNNFVAQGLISTNLALNGLADTNLSGLVSSNFALFTTLNGSAVSKTSTAEQVMQSSLQSRGTMHAQTNLVAADTNTVSSEKLSNGTFTGNAAGWALTNASYNANNVLVLPSAAASVTYTSTTPVVAGKVYLLSWANDLAYGTNFTTFTVVVGGDTNAFGFAPTGTIAQIFKARNSQQPQFFVTPGTNQWVGDTISLKEITAGDFISANDGFIGGQLFVGESISTTGSITAASFSGLHNETQGLASVLSFGSTATKAVAMTTNQITFDPGGSDESSHIVAADGGIEIVNDDAGSSRLYVDGVIISTEVGLSDDFDGLYEQDSETPIATHNANGTFAYGGGAFTVSNTVMRGNASGLTNISAAQLLPGSTFGALNAANLTNLPAAATTAGVNQITQDSNAVGNVRFSVSTHITPDLYGTNDFGWSINAGVVSGSLVAAGSLDGSHIAAGGISNSDLAAWSVTGGNIDATNRPIAAGTFYLSTDNGGTSVQWKAVAGGGGAVTNLADLDDVDSVDTPTTGHVLTYNGSAWSNSAPAAGGGDITNELSYDLQITWGTPRWPVAASNSIDMTARVVSDTLSSHTATTSTDCIMFSVTSVSNTLQGVTRAFMFNAQAGTRTNFAISLRADQTATGSFVFLFFNPGGIGPTAVGMTGTVSAADTTTVLNVPTAGTFLTNVARGVKIHGDLTCYSASTNAANQRLQGIMDFKEQR